MDGFAVAAADLPESGAITLPAGAAIAAGDAPGELAPGTTRPIMTGAPVPAGADAVVPVEESRSEEHTSELQSRGHLVCRLLLEKKKKKSRGTARLHRDVEY